MLTDWVDVWGEPQAVADDDLIAVLSALLQRPLDTSADITAALDDLSRDAPPVEPVIVAWDGTVPQIALGRDAASAVIVTENGAEAPLSIDGRTLTLDQTLPLGYHRLHIDGLPGSSLIIAAPESAHPPPQGQLGVMAPVYSMRSIAKDTGIGNLGHLGQLADIAFVGGASVIGTLPLVATFPDQPSPYSPASRRAWNEILVDLAAAPGWEGPLPESDGDALWVDYDETGTSIRSRLAAYTARTRDMPQIRTQIDSFAGSNPEVKTYAEFRATCDQHGRNWRAWPADAQPAPDRIDYHTTGQWLASQQLSRLGTRLRERDQYLYLDLPIGCHPDGYDIWDQPDMYAAAGVGAPPDSLFLGGQDWGLPAPIPRLSRADGHSAYIKAIRHQLSVAGLLRIDHVMGLHRSWWVPHGLAATQGAYVMQPTDEMFAIVCLESHRAGAAVVGENLGTVPPKVAEALEGHDLLGMKIAQDGLDEPSPSELIALSTHDTAPFAAWWKETDINDAQDLGVYADGRGEVARAHRIETIAYLEKLFSTAGLPQTRDAIMDWMARSQAAIAIVNVDDMWEEERRQNVPGTDTERPNWRARHKHPIEAVARDAALRARLERLHELRDESWST